MPTRVPSDPGTGPAARNRWDFQPGTALGQYRVVRLLGKGGMGEVYEVEHTVLGRRFALKLLPPDFASRPGALKRFRREARVMANLEHPNVLRVDDFGETQVSTLPTTGTAYWLRMELAKGYALPPQPSDSAALATAVSLAQLLTARGGRLPLPLASGIFRQVLAGLAHAHSRGVIHRDLKPANILLTGCLSEPGAAGLPEAKIADFGIARLVGEEWSTAQASSPASDSVSTAAPPATDAAAMSDPRPARTVLGTFEYMSPEQRRGDPVTAASDVYAMGVIMYRALTGHLVGPRPPSGYVSDLPKAWDRVILRALEDAPGDRHPDAHALLAALPPALPPPPPPPPSAATGAAAPQQAAHKLVVHRQGCGPAAAPAFGERFADLVPVGGPEFAPTDALAPGSLEAQQRQRQAALTLALPVEVRSRRTGIALRLLPAGAFTMGSPAEESGRRDNEGPLHHVVLNQPFYCGKFEVTQGQWQAVMGANPSFFRTAGSLAPVESVNWSDCQEFCRRLCVLEGTAEGTYRLLTEAEWEYACRAGTATAVCNGDLVTVNGRPADLHRVAWYGEDRGGGPHPVGTKLTNGFGLHDMHGNVWEWCEDWYDAYSAGPVVDPLGPASGSGRVIRGGGWNYEAARCRSADRRRFDPDRREYYLGLRIARDIPAH